ncbi:hypothetical protein EYF80_002111 [Liparis tanakae]|uniref:Uncharacterized protein n=1 Tax=Liparis tanakae TaxID=230148 RepID=A0A4Z2JD58_9TELE|nr:hypothetical protein EYF80_002111 [Liparis tanakae]
MAENYHYQYKTQACSPADRRRATERSSGGRTPPGVARRPRAPGGRRPVRLLRGRLGFASFAAVLRSAVLAHGGVERADHGEVVQRGRLLFGLRALLYDYFTPFAREDGLHWEDGVPLGGPRALQSGLMRRRPSFSFVTEIPPSFLFFTSLGFLGQTAMCLVLLRRMVNSLLQCGHTNTSCCAATCAGDILLDEDLFLCGITLWTSFFFLLLRTLNFTWTGDSWLGLERFDWLGLLEAFSPFVVFVVDRTPF